jgi:C-terminal processing protease CtpA/Prc
MWGQTVGIAPATQSRGAEDAALPQATEIINILKTRYVDHDALDQKLLNDATITGMLKALGVGATLVTPEPVVTNAAPSSATNTVAVAPLVASSAPDKPLARAEVIETDIGYVRLADVTEWTPAALGEELKRFSHVKVIGCVLDLRFADGTNYASAAAVASRFLPGDRDLFTVKRAVGGAETFHTRAATTIGAAQSDAPLLVLVNGQTRGCAEALAGALQAQDRCILVGNQTAGSAVAWDDVPLSDGRVLRVASAKIVLAPHMRASVGQASADTNAVAHSTNPEQAGMSIFPRGLTPDVQVKIDAQVEREALLNSATNTSLTASLQPHRANKSISEAELVKAFRGEALETEKPAAENDTEKMRDVVLQRAVDVLKGIRVLTSQR